MDDGGSGPTSRQALGTAVSILVLVLLATLLAGRQLAGDVQVVVAGSVTLVSIIASR